MAALLFAFLFFQNSFAFNLQTPEVYQAGLSLNNNGGVIFAGGSSSVDSSETANGPYSNLVQIYGEGEPEDGSDYRKLSSSRAALAGVVLNGTVAIFGGGQDDLQSSAPYTDVVDFLSLTDASMPIIQSARLSQPRAYLTSAATDNSAYFIAGFTNNNDTRSTVVDRYYMPTGKWSTISLPYGRAGHTSIAIGGYVFIAGGTYDQNPELGTDELTILIEDDTGAVSMLPYNTWEIRGNRSNLASAALRYDGVNYIFIGGGEGPSCGCEIGWMCTDNFSFCAADLVDIFAIYDNGTITQDFDMMQSIEPRSRLSALAYGNLVFFAGGLNITGWSAMVDIYNIETDEWTQDQLSVPRGDLTAAQSLPKCTSNSTNLKDEVCGGVKLYFAGGIGYDGVVNVVDVYDVDTGLWVSTFM